MRQNTENKSTTLRVIIGMIITFLIYSSTGIFSKLASNYTFLSFQYNIFLAGAIATLGIYAILWQIILKQMPLNKAYIWKSSTIIFSLIYASLIFQETITVQNLIGSGFLIVGITILSQKK